MMCRIGFGAAAVFVLASGMAACRAQPADLQVRRDVEYVRRAGAALRLDVYLPPPDARAGGSDGVAQPAPLIVWVHGGAWRAGSKVDVPILPLAKQGFAIASVDYRLSPVAKFPAQTQDIHAAIRFLRKEASTYGIDTKRIAVAGSSAGGHLAALVGVSADAQELTGQPDETQRTPSGVGAIVSFYGASNLESILSQSTEHGLSVRVPALKLLLGGLPEEEPRLARLASPVAHVDADDPPLFWIHGDADPQMPYAQAIEMRDAYAKHDLPFELVTVKGGLHGGEGFYDDAMLKRVAQFLREHLQATNER